VAQRRRTKAEAKVVSAKQTLASIEEQERRCLAQAVGIGCQRHARDAKLRSFEERKKDAHEQLRGAIAELERSQSRDLETCEQIAGRSIARSPGNEAMEFECQGNKPRMSARVSKASAKSPRPPMIVVAGSKETEIARSQSPNAGPRSQNRSGSSSVPAPAPWTPLPGARRITTSPSRQRSPPLGHRSPTRQSSSCALPRPKSPAHRMDPSPSRRQVSPPKVPPRPRTARTSGGTASRADVQAKLAAMPEEELRLVLTSLPREQLEGALAQHNRETRQ